MIFHKNQRNNSTPKWFDLGSWNFTNCFKLFCWLCWNLLSNAMYLKLVYVSQGFMCHRDFWFQYMGNWSFKYLPFTPELYMSERKRYRKFRNGKSWLTSVKSYQWLDSDRTEILIFSFPFYSFTHVTALHRGLSKYLTAQDTQHPRASEPQWLEWRSNIKLSYSTDLTFFPVIP